MQKRTEYVVQAETTKLYDAKTGEMFEVELPQKEVSVAKYYDWQDTEAVVKQMLEIPDMKIVGQQFADKKKTANYLLDSEKMFSDYGFADMVEWDTAWLKDRGVAAPKYNQIQVAAQAIISAKPQIKNEITLTLMRMRCKNGVTKTVFRHSVPLMQGHDILIEKPDNENPVALIKNGLDHMPDMQAIEAEILDDKIVSNDVIVKRIETFRNMLNENFISHKRGESPEPIANRFLENHFTPLRNSPNWFVKALDNQFEIIQDNANTFKGQGRGLLAYDIDNAVTNVVNHSRDKKRDNNFYIGRNANALTSAIATWFAFQA